MDRVKSYEKKGGRPRKSRKFTVILTVSFLLIGGLIGLGLLTLVASNANNIDAQWAMVLEDAVYERERAFLLWRVFIYLILIGGFYIWSRKYAASTSTKLIKLSTVRIVLYLIIFELFVVQNSLYKLVSLIAG